MSARGWSEAEFDAFVAARSPALVRFAYALTGDLGHAEDVVQTALLKSFFATRRRRPEQPEAYVRTAIVRANLARFRRRRVVEHLVDVVPDAAPARELPASRLEEVERLRDRLAALTPRQRAVVVLRYVEDWPEAQVAQVLGVRVGTVKTLASRGLAVLRAREPLVEVHDG